jgi:predicted phage tail protein
MLTEIRLQGILGKRFGRKWHLNVRSPVHAVHAIDTLRPGFRAAIMELGECDFWVKVGGKTVGERLVDSPSAGKTISISPVIRGAGGNTLGVVELVAGIVLIGVGIYFGGPIGGQLALLGVAAVLGGVASFLAPAPASTVSVDHPSYIFNGVVNSVQQGDPVPICYGYFICGSQVVSASIETADYTIGSTTTKGSGSGGGSNQGPGVPALPISTSPGGQ